MPHIIEALATALLSEDQIHFSKLDFKDGFWIMVCAFGEEWNFTYVLPNHLEAPTKLVMGWIIEYNNSLWNKSSV